MKECEKCGETYEDGFDSCWKCAGKINIDPEKNTPRKYKRCMACGSEKLAEAFLKPNSPLNGSGEVEIISKEKDTGLTFLPPKTSSSVNCIVCGDCGYIALFADKLQAIYKAYMGEAQG